MTLLIEEYLNENRQKQQKLPRIVVKQLKQNNKHSNSGQDSSDSNLAIEPIETEMDENVDLDHVNEEEEKSDLTLKESIVKFFVRILFLLKYNKFRKISLNHN